MKGNSVWDIKNAFFELFSEANELLGLNSQAVQKPREKILIAEEWMEPSFFEIAEKAITNVSGETTEPEPEKQKLPDFDSWKSRLATDWNAQVLVKQHLAPQNTAISAWNITRRCEARLLEKSTALEHKNLDLGSVAPLPIHIQDDDILLTIRLHDNEMISEFIVRGGTALSELRDHIYCKHDTIFPGRDRLRNYCFLFDDNFFCSTEYLRR